MGVSGPNDPCACGSGRAHKYCCAGGPEARQAALASTRVRDSALSKLLAFAFQPVFDADHSVAEGVFWGELIRNPAPGEVQRLLDSEGATVKYNAWFLFDWQIESTTTVADLFLNEPSVRLPDAERQFLLRISQAHLRLYEVEAVDPGRSVRLLDLWTGERVVVLERTASKEIVTWDLLGARVAADGLGGHVFEGGLFLYPADGRAHILARLRRAHRRYERQSPTADLSAFFRKHGALFHHLWLELVAFPEPPQLLTTEGDPLVFCRAVFYTPDPDAVRALIGRQPDMQPAEGGRLAWCECARGDVHEVGRWGFEGRRVVFETTSQARAARGRALLEAIAGELVTYRATSLETLEQTMSELRHTERGAQLVPPGGDLAAVQELFDRQYHVWLDRPDPALGNRTPRAAAQTRLWRPRVVHRLKLIQNTVERAALAGRPAYDFAWVWKELGVEGRSRGVAEGPARRPRERPA